MGKNRVIHIILTFLKGKDATKDGEKETVEISGEEEGKPEENA